VSDPYLLYLANENMFKLKLLEVYRQQFGRCKQRDDQTDVEFASEKERLFEKWLTSIELSKHLHKFRQLMCFEEFKQCIHSDIKTYLDEHKVSSLAEAVSMADDYALTDKLFFFEK